MQTLTRTEQATTSIPRDDSIKRKARVAGLLYLSIFVIAPFAFLISKANILVDGDAAATAANLAANETQFRFGMVAESVVFLIEIVLAALLFVILRPVSRGLSFAAASARVSEAVIQAANLLTSFVALTLVGGTGYLAAFQADELNALTSLFLDANESVILVWGLFFALHLALLGYLVYKAGFFPRILGVLLMVASTGYFIESFGNILSPGSADTLSNVVMVLAVPGELVFALYLAIKGLSVDKWHARRALMQ